MKKLIYATFSECSADGIQYVLHDETMKEYLETKDEYTFIMEIELPETGKEEITKMGVAAIDNKIKDANAKCVQDIKMLNEKKEQLLALTHNAV